jgi:hypothetical protein
MGGQTPNHFDRSTIPSGGSMHSTGFPPGASTGKTDSNDVDTNLLRLDHMAEENTTMFTPWSIVGAKSKVQEKKKTQPGRPDGYDV